MWKKIKQILNKEKFCYATGHVNPLEFHSVVYFLTKSYGMLDESGFAWSGFLQTFMICCPIPGLVICMFGVYHGWKILDAGVIIEAGTYVIILSYKLSILTCVKLNMSDFHVLMRVLRSDFHYICTDGNKYRERFFQNQLQTWKICIFVVVSMSVMTLGMAAAAVLSLIYFLITHDPESEGQRPLVFPFWAFDVDFKESPHYEIAFFYSDIIVIAYGYNYIFMIATQILWIREIAAKADLVIWKMQDLMEDIRPATNKEEADVFSNVIKYRLRAIIQQHHSMYYLMEHYSRVFKKLLMFEQTFCGPVVCLTAYSAAEKLEDGEVNYILILLCISSLIVALVPSYLCTFLRIKVSSVVNACLDIPFWNAGPVVRPYLVLIIQRSLRPLPLSFGGFQEVSLQTFANIIREPDVDDMIMWPYMCVQYLLLVYRNIYKMASAYSCFNMLRQAFK